MKYAFQRELFFNFIFLVVLIASPTYGQKFFVKPDMMHTKMYSYSDKVFNKNCIVKTNDNSDSVKSPSLSNLETDSSKRQINIGRMVGFATIGFLSGLFLGASTDNSGFFQGPVFHLKPALIGAGIGIVLSLIVPDTDKNIGKTKKRN